MYTENLAYTDRPGVYRYYMETFNGGTAYVLSGEDFNQWVEVETSEKAGESGRKTLSGKEAYNILPEEIKFRIKNKYPAAVGFLF